MPTRDRRPLIPLAIRSFLNQTHQERELIILDDGTDETHQVIPNDPRITYVLLPQPPLTIGAKRNALVNLARGPICVNFDSDDWSSPDRIEHQLTTLTTTGKALVGFSNLYYWDMTANQAYIWNFPGNYPPATGSSQMYTKAWALAHPYRPINIPEDRYFEAEAVNAKQIASEPGLAYLVARFHTTNTWKTTPRNRGYRPAAAFLLPQQFFLDMKEP